MALKFVFFTFGALFPVGGLYRLEGFSGWSSASSGTCCPLCKKGQKTKNKTKDKKQNFPFGFFFFLIALVKSLRGSKPKIITKMRCG